MVVYHPAFAVLFAFIPLVGILIAFEKLFDTGEDYVAYKDQIAITESQLVFGETKSSATVDVIGTIKNTSRIAWKEVEFHVDFFDATGKRMDVGEKENSYFYLPASGTSSFKVTFTREFPETNYVKQRVSVVKAKDARAKW